MRAAGRGCCGGSLLFRRGSRRLPRPGRLRSWVTTLPPEYGDVADDQVLFRLQTHGARAPAGTFSVVHVDHAGGLYAHAVGDITCVSVSDGVAVTTGIIRHAWFRDFPGSLVVDTAVAITVADNGANDAVGFDFEFFDGREIPLCDAVPPVIRLARGDFTIR